MVEDQRASQPATLQESQRSSNYCAFAEIGTLAQIILAVS